MDLDSLDAPMFVDFDMIKRGEEEGEGDEWFDKKIDDDDDTFTNTSSSLTDKDPKLTQLASPAQPVAREQPQVTKEEPTEPNEEPFSDDAVKTALAIMASNPPPTRKRKSSERSAALKATASIHSMLKPSTNTSKVMMTKDQYDQQKIEQIRKEAERQRELSKKSFRMFKKRCAAGSHNSSTLAPLKTKPPTQPVEFHFKTDERCKNTPTSHASTSSESPFPNNLRVSDKPEYIPNDPSERKPSTPKAPTKPKPFTFQTDARIRSRGITPRTTEKYVSGAELIEKFEKKTPPRFRTKRPRRSVSSERDYYSTRVTVGVSPKLTVRHRSRSPHYMSNAEREERMMEEFKKNPFKARPIPPNLFKGGDQCSGIPQVSALNKIPLTTAVSPNITKPTVNRRDISESEKDIQPQAKRFKALPIPRDMFSSVIGVPVKRPMDVTVPQSPNITKRKKTPEDEEEPTSPPTAPIKPLPMPKFNAPFQPTLTHNPSTVLQPFSFHNKYTSKDEVIEQLVKKEEEELAKKREFTARKMPEPAPPPTIVKTHRKTLPEPFALKTDELGEKKVAKFQEKVAELEKEREEMSKFKASDPSSLYTSPFVPSKSTKPLTEASNTFVLHTELRSELRSQYELEKKSREEEKQRIEEERQAVREAEEAEEIKALRRSLVHKAQPIHHYTPLSIVPSTKKPTTATSPVLISKQRKENESHDL